MYPLVIYHGKMDFYTWPIQKDDLPVKNIGMFHSHDVLWMLPTDGT